MKKPDFWNRIERTVERGIERAADRLPGTLAKTYLKKRKADQAYQQAQDRHEKNMARRDQIIEVAALKNIALQKQIEKQDIKIEKDRIKLEEMRAKHGRK